MTTVQQAEQIILSLAKNYGDEQVRIHNALGRMLAENILCDRDLPAFDRVSMDGIAIRYQAFADGCRTFRIKATQAAGDIPVEIGSAEGCIEIMTGAALPGSADTIIRYEDLIIENGTATISIETISKGQNVHYKGKDKKQNEVAANAGILIDPAVIGIAATMGKAEILVKKLPSVVIISTGDELVEIDEIPSPFQIRRSNSDTLKAVLQQFGIEAQLLHIQDEPVSMEQKLLHCLAHFDVLLLSGGISMGKYDYLPMVLDKIGVEQLFHKVEQRPGKPFWFGRHNGNSLVFAFPGNPVSSFLCLHRYFLPWLERSMDIKDETIIYALLDRDVTFTPPLQYFMQVRLSGNELGQIMATPVEGNGSGDLANLISANAFLELPMEMVNFNKGEVYRAWPFKKIFG